MAKNPTKYEDEPEDEPKVKGKAKAETKAETKIAPKSGEPWPPAEDTSNPSQLQPYPEGNPPAPPPSEGDLEQQRTGKAEDKK